MAGAFLALGANGRAALMFGVPPGLLFDPSGSEPRTVRECWVLAPLDRELPSGTSPYGSAAGVGTLEAIVIAPQAEAPSQLLERATITLRGLEGDRYFTGAGTFSNGPGGGRALTLVEVEVLDELRLDPREARRNLVTRGIALNPLVGHRFAVGDAECFGNRLCEPCAHLDRVAGRRLLSRLVHRGGLRADVLAEGIVEPGAPIRALE